LGPYTAPLASGGWVPKFGGQGPPTEILLLGNLRFFANTYLPDFYRNCRHLCPLRNGRHIGPRPLPVWTLGGANGYFSRSIFSATPADIDTVLSPLGVALGSLYSAPNHWGVGPPIWGSGPPNRNLRLGTLRFFLVFYFL